jgi:hypothetical protein
LNSFFSLLKKSIKATGSFIKYNFRLLNFIIFVGVLFFIVSFSLRNNLMYGLFKRINADHIIFIFIILIVFAVLYILYMVYTAFNFIVGDKYGTKLSETAKKG